MCTKMSKQAIVGFVYDVYFHFYFVSGVVAFTDAHFGQSAGNVLIGGVGCTGTETSLLDCSYTSGLCQHTDDAGVRCQSELYVQ